MKAFDALICFVFAVLFALNIFLGNEIGNLKHDVKCLQHPHGESSVAGVFKMVNGSRTFVVTQPAKKTGC